MTLLKKSVNTKKASEANQNFCLLLVTLPRLFLFNRKWSGAVLIVILQICIAQFAHAKNSEKKNVVETLMQELSGKENLPEESPVEEYLITEGLTKERLAKENLAKERLAKESLAKKSLITESLAKKTTPQEATPQEKSVTKSSSATIEVRTQSSAPANLHVTEPPVKMFSQKIGEDLIPLVNQVIETVTKSLPIKNDKNDSSFSEDSGQVKESDALVNSENADEPDDSDESYNENEIEPLPAPAPAIQSLNSEQKIEPVGSNETTTIHNKSVFTPGQREHFVNEFENFVATKIAPKVPGLALAIIADGKVKVLQGYGRKRIDRNDFVNTNTVFRLASVSKTIASTAAGVMVRDGKMNWDTTITSQLPEVIFSNSRYGDKITLRDIMSQATGLPTHTNTHLIEDNVPYANAVSRLRYVNFVCPPSKCYAYQNVTFSLIGNLILKKTGTAFDKYVNEKLFKPLGMSSASFGLAGLQATNNFAQPHVMYHSRWMATKIEENYYHIYPAAGANASISDMAQWVLAQMGHKPDILPSELLKQLHQKVTRNTPAQSHYGAILGATDTHYGLGWRIFDYRGDKNFVHHGGWVKGFRSEVVFNQELQIGMVLLTNSETKLARNIIFKFLDAYKDDKLGTRKVAAESKKTKFKG